MIHINKEIAIARKLFNKNEQLVDVRRILLVYRKNTSNNIFQTTSKKPKEKHQNWRHQYKLDYHVAVM